MRGISLQTLHPKRTSGHTIPNNPDALPAIQEEDVIVMIGGMAIVRQVLKLSMYQDLEEIAKLYTRLGEDD
jgi:hypothetical protein